LTFPDDDGSVVVMTVKEYLYDTEESRCKRELHYGRVSEPPAPFFPHQSLVLRVARILASHVDSRRLGQVAVAPVDVILDAEQHLIVQPDVLFVSQSRASIVRDQVWGAPDLVVEVLSVRNHLFDRGQKLGWYHKYGVRECWLIDRGEKQVWVGNLTATPFSEQIAKGSATIRSMVLPDLFVSAWSIFQE